MRIDREGRRGASGDPGCGVRSARGRGGVRGGDGWTTRERVRDGASQGVGLDGRARDEDGGNGRR